jgi:hypothetical protein
VLVKSLLVFGPAPLNLSDTTGRYMWAVGEIGMKDQLPLICAHKEVVDLSLTIVPDGITGCLADPFAPQLILPGRNPFYLLANEQKWVLYRTRFECHDSAAPGIYPLDIELCITHHTNPSYTGDTANGAELGYKLLNNCQERTKSLLIE